MATSTFRRIVVLMSPAETTRKTPGSGAFLDDIVALSPRDALLLRAIQRSGRAVVRLDRDKVHFGGLSGIPLQKAFARLARRGWVRRLERGAYVVLGPGGVRTHHQLAIVADWLEGRDYVVSGFAALAYWDLTQHAPTRVEVLVRGWKSPVRYEETEYRFVRVTPDRLSRADRERVRGARAELLIASPERALVDAAAGPHAVGIATLAQLLERGLHRKRLHRTRLVRELTAAPRAALRRIGWLTSLRRDPLSEQLARFVGWSGYVRLDAGRPATGARRNSTWRVLENTDAQDFAT